MKYDQIIWLSSYPKSGNTWLRCFLDAYLLGKVDINEIVSSVTDDVASRALPGDGSDPSTYPIDVQQLTRPMALLRLVREFNKNRFADVPLFVKTHSAHMLTNGIELLPMCLTKGVIHIVRDPRDVVVSFSKHMGKSIDEAIDLFTDKTRVLHDERRPKLSDMISSWPMHVGSYANADSHNVLVVKYEDMKSHPIETFMGILAHTGLPLDTERLKKALEVVDIANLKKQEQEHGFKESSPFQKDKFFGEGKGWKGVLSTKQVFRIEKACKSMMKRYGYEFSMKAVA